MSASLYDRALTLLTARAYTIVQMRRKLQPHGEPVEVDAVIERLLSSRLLDDAAYAVQFARQKLVDGGAARRRIRQDLARRGIPAAAADEAIDNVMDEEEYDPMAGIEMAARKKLAALGDLDDAVRKRRLFAYLARRGYELDNIKEVIAKLIS